MFDMQWDLRGFDAVRDRMKALETGLRAKAGRSALGSAARVVTNVAKQNALRVDDAETGRTIAANVTQRFRSKYQKRTGDLMVSVGVGTERGRIPPGNPDTGPKGNTPHWHLIELGTKEAKAQPFLRPALDASMDKVQQVFAAKLDQQITKLLAKVKG